MGTSPSLVFLLLCWRLPESPVWLMRKGREEEARQTLAWLRGGKYDIEPEVEELRSIITEEQNSSGTSVLKMLKKRTFVLPLILSSSTSGWMSYFPPLSQASVSRASSSLPLLISQTGDSGSRQQRRRNTRLGQQRGKA